jgi:hypothetical protein
MMIQKVSTQDPSGKMILPPLTRINSLDARKKEESLAKPQSPQRTFLNSVVQGRQERKNLCRRTGSLSRPSFFFVLFVTPW